MIPVLEQAATLADQAGGALHSAAVQPTRREALVAVAEQLADALAIVIGAIPPEPEPVAVVAPAPAPAPKPKRGKR